MALEALVEEMRHWPPPNFEDDFDYGAYLAYLESPKWHELAEAATCSSQ
jgi:hypothetical protein